MAIRLECEWEDLGCASLTLPREALGTSFPQEALK